MEVSHLFAEAGELIQSFFDARAILVQLCRAGFGDLVKFFRAFRFRSGVSGFFQIGERRINHAGTGRIHSAGVLFDLLDDLVAVARFLTEQSQDDQLKISGGEHFRHAHSRTADESSSETTKESSTTETVAAATFITVMMLSVVHVVAPLTLNMSYVVSHDIFQRNRIA